MVHDEKVAALDIFDQGLLHFWNIFDEGGMVTIGHERAEMALG
jgi:hypothetical protein